MDRILVEIIGENGVVTKRYPVIGDKIQIEKATKGRGNVGYFAEIPENAIRLQIRGLGPLKWVRRKVYLQQGAGKCISWPKGTEPEMPRWDRKTLRELFEANVLKAAGSVTQRIQLPSTFYIVAMIPAIISILILLVVTGRLKI